MTPDVGNRCAVARSSLSAGPFADAAGRRCVFTEGHQGNHRDQHGITWYRVPLNLDLFDLDNGEVW